MGRTMTADEKYSRREARTYGGWTASAMRAARLLQHEADSWRELEDEAEVDHERSKRCERQADERLADAVKYARKAAHWAGKALRAAAERHAPAAGGTER